MKWKELSIRQKIGWGLTVPFALFIAFMSAINKLTLDEGSAELFASHGLEGWLLIIGIGELASLLFFLIPKTMRLGMVLFSAYFGGAIMFHMSESEDFSFPAIFLIGVWVIASLRQKGSILNV